MFLLMMWTEYDRCSLHVVGPCVVQEVRATLWRQDCCVTAGSVSGARDMHTQQLQAFVARFSLSIFLNVEAHLSDVLAEWLVG